MESEQAEKFDFLNNMNFTLKTMLGSGRFDKSTQVDEVELSWGMLNISDVDIIEREYISKPEMNFATTAFEFRGKEKVLKNYKIEDNKDLIIYEHMKKDPTDFYEDTKLDKNTVPNIDNSNKNEQNLNLESLLKKENLQEKINKKNTDNAFDSWKLPFGMMIFLKNVFEERDTVKVLPWLIVKKTIFEIYYDRIENEEEISGHISNNFINLEEYTCIYFLKTYNLRRLAESKLMEFVASLKYFSRIWCCSNLFARLCNFMSPLNIGKNQLENSLTNDHDIYTQ